MAKRVCQKLINRRMMGTVLKSRINPVSGESEWTFEEEDYDFIQETARSGYADMLHDHERNVMFNEAIRKVVSEQKKRLGKPVHVLDIGTGTGLLSMMAARAGANKVTAIEAFAPVAETARKIIDRNGFSDKINVLNIRSTDVNENLLGDKADVCVAEVFDTELIGEGALRTFKEAHTTMLKQGSRVIPASAKIFVQPIQSQKVLRWEKPQSVNLPEFGIQIQPPESCRNCFGAASVHDVQLDELPKDCFTPVSPPAEIFRFNFEDPDSIEYNEERTVRVPVNDSVDIQRIDAVLFWWELDMDGSAEIILSTEPNWMKKRPSQWRDHWMQAIYYLREPLGVIPGGIAEIVGAHDEYSFWFRSQSRQDEPQCRRPVCDCGLHTICSRTSFGRFNDSQRYSKFAQAMAKKIRGASLVVISDCSLLPLVAAQLGAKDVISIEKNPIAKRIALEYARTNELSGVVKVMDSVDQIPDSFQVDAVVGDPFFFSSLLPWHNLHFWYATRELCRRSGSIVSVYPKLGILYAMPIELKDLWKIRAPVGTVEGFDLSIFDDLIQKAMDSTDAIVEPHPLWEYPAVACGEKTSLFAWDLAEELPTSSLNAKTELSISRGGVNAIAFWMEWHLNEEIIISTGLEGSCNTGEMPNWHWYSRQGVYFLPEAMRKMKILSRLTCSVTFDPNSGAVNFSFQQ